MLNLLLPFTNPQTPLAQDLIHTVVLCGTLYFAPQIAEYYNPPNTTNTTTTDNVQPTDDLDDTSTPDEPMDDIPIDEGFVLQPDTDEGEDVLPPPHAPTPPPGQARAPPPLVPPPAADAAPWDNDDAGPANANDRPQPTRANRTIGTKKAKSLARRDQRRAYHEFHRSQAEQRRALEESGREAREAALATEKARRAEVEREIAERERADRERRKEEERKEQEEERERRERVISRVRSEVDEQGAVDLVDIAWTEGKDRVWIERLVRASGMLAQMENQGEKVMITGDGWLVRIDAALMQKAYAEAIAFGEARSGAVSFADFSGMLEKAVKVRATAVS